MCWAIGASIGGKNYLNLTLIQYIKINSKLIIDLNVRINAIAFLKKTDLELGKNFLDMT